MDFGLTDEQRNLRDRVIEFARSRLSDDVTRRDEQNQFSREAWEACAEFGIQGLVVPREHGGSSADSLTFTIAMEALGYGCADNGLLFALGAQICSVQAPIARFGTDDQKSRYLPTFCDGSVIGAHGMTEPDAGSDAFSLSTSAERRGDAFVLNGSKCFTTAGPIADVLLVFAKTKPTGGFSGVSAFLVDASTPGVNRGRDVMKMGLRTAPFGEIYFDDCAVPADNLLGTPGSGFAIFSHSMDWERTHILACALGTMQRQVERAVARGSARHRIGDLEVRLRASRLLLYQTAWLRSQGRSVALQSALAKLSASEAFVASSLEVMSMHGELGAVVHAGVERDVRDAVGGRIYSGTSDIQRNIAAARLGL